MLCSSSGRLYCTCSLVCYFVHAFTQAVYQVEGCARYVSNDTLLLILCQRPLHWPEGSKQRSENRRIILGHLVQGNRRELQHTDGYRNYLCQQHKHVSGCSVLSVCISAVTIQHNLQFKTKSQRYRVVFAVE